MKPRDQNYLGQIQDYYAKHRVLPSYSGIAELVGMKSTSAAAGMIKRLKAAGYVETGPGRRLQPTSKFFERKVVEGAPSLGAEVESANVVANYGIDAYIVQDPSHTVLVEVKGNSMAKAGILEGDTVVVRKGANAKVGDIVVANVDGVFTVKFLTKDEGDYLLEPSGKGQETIRPHGGPSIYGLVTGCFRKVEQHSGDLANNKKSPVQSRH